MAYTEADLAAVDAALLALAKGERVATVSSSDGRSVTYAQAEFDKLRRFRAEMASEISSAAGRRRFVLTTTGKGL